jgi:hypothetical protein
MLGVCDSFWEETSVGLPRRSGFSLLSGHRGFAEMGLLPEAAQSYLSHEDQGSETLVSFSQSVVVK